jgi:hypothetical protein
LINLATVSLPGRGYVRKGGDGTDYCLLNCDAVYSNGLHGVTRKTLSHVAAVSSCSNERYSTSGSALFGTKETGFQFAVKMGESSRRNRVNLNIHT